MDNAEKFVWLQNGALELFLRDYITSVECGELQDFLDKIEERWDMFDE